MYVLNGLLLGLYSKGHMFHDKGIEWNVTWCNYNFIFYNLHLGNLSVERLRIWLGSDREVYFKKRTLGGVG